MQLRFAFAPRSSFNLLRRLVTKSRMQSFLVVIAFDKLLDVTVQILQISVFVGTKRAGPITR
jgi:hypothetical protein